MININDYYRRIFFVFLKSMEENPELGKLKKLDCYREKDLCYSNPHHQQIYLVKYIIAHAFEFKIMYMSLFKRKRYEEEIKITSLGCKDMLDYWGVTRALAQIHCPNCKISYRGLDENKWNYGIEKRETDEIKFIKGNVIESFESLPGLEDDVYCLASPISDYTVDEIRRISDCFENKKITKPLFHLLIKIRAEQEDMRSDASKVKTLMNAICKRNYYTNDIPASHIAVFNQIRKVCDLDRDIQYPYDLMSEMERFDLFPILNTEIIKYQIVSFIRF